MAFAAVVLIGVPLVLLLLGAAILAQAGVALRRVEGSRAATIIRLITGAGLIGWALLSTAWLVADMQYGVVVFPMLGMVGALVWILILLPVAGVVELVHQRRRPRE